MSEHGGTGQPGHGDGIPLATADDPGAVVGLLIGEKIETLDDRLERLRGHVFREDFGTRPPAALETREPAGAGQRRDRPAAMAVQERAAGQGRRSLTPVDRDHVLGLSFLTGPCLGVGFGMNLETHHQFDFDRDILVFRRFQPLARRWFVVRDSYIWSPGTTISRIATIGPSSTWLNRASRSARVRASATAFS